MLIITPAAIRRDKHKAVISSHWILPLVFLGRSYHNKIQGTSQTVRLSDHLVGTQAQSVQTKLPVGMGTGSGGDELSKWGGNHAWEISLVL